MVEVPRPVDPRAKLALAVAYTAALVGTTRGEFLLIGLAAVIWLILALGLLSPWLRMLRLTVVMTAVVFVVSILSFGLQTALSTALRLLAIVSGSFLFSQMTPPEDLANVLVRMRVPYAFAFILTTGMQFVPVIQRRLAEVRDAQRARGIRLEGDLGSLRNYPALLVPLLVSSFQLADQLAEAMEARGFGSPHRSSALVYRLRWADYGLLLLSAAGLMAALHWGR
jgi:energy-coupling factor transport system permease protein